MGKRYSETEMKRILRQDIGTSVQVEEKIQEAYRRIYQDQSYESVRERKGRPKFGKWMALAAAIGLLAVSSITVLAINGFFSTTVNQEGDSLSYEFQVNYELTPTVVTVEAGYIPEGYEPIDESGLKYDKEGYRQNGISLGVLTANTLDERGEWSESSIKSLEKTEINGMEAHLITRNYDPERVTRIFDKVIYLFNPEEGYVGVVYGGNDLSMEELKKVAEGLTFTRTDEVLEYTDEEEKERREASLEAYAEKEKISRDYGVPREYIYEVGKVFNYQQEILQAEAAYLEDNPEESENWGDYYEQYIEELKGEKGVNLQVASVEVLDSIEGLPTECFFEYDERIAPQLTEEKTLKPYTRVTYEDDEETERTEVTQKFVKVCMKAENLSEETIDFWAGSPQLVTLEAVEEGNYKYPSEDTEPLNGQEYNVSADKASIYFDQSPYAGERNSHFFFRDMAAGEILEYTLVFPVDEDRLDNMYLKFGTEYGSLAWENEVFHNRYVNISQ